MNEHSNMNADSYAAETEVGAERKRLMQAGRLHWLHWGVLSLSLLLTFGAWQITKSQVDEKVASQFERESAQVITMIGERMQKYEDALWGGVGTLQTRDRAQITSDEWKRFSNALNIDVKYPGINGIGVIEKVPRDELRSYLGVQHQDRPRFRTHPEHDEEVLFPITHIEPVASNRQAVGLDMAHETNRRMGLLRSQNTGLAQITGPIVLVQDSEKTPGFLFYAPFYLGEGSPVSQAERAQRFAGVVYAPFIVHKLMRGVLHPQNRHVGIRISDGEEVIYDDNRQGEKFSGASRFRQTSSVELYGRTWSFEIWSGAVFESRAASRQPLTILIGGLLIDSLLLLLFVALSRTNRRALNYAAMVTEDLQLQKRQLELSNEDLENFAYVASHDLQEPLRMVASYTELVQERYQDHYDDKGRKYAGYVTEGVERMQTLLSDLLIYSRATHNDKPPVSVDCEEVVDNVIEDLSVAVSESEAQIRVVGALPSVTGHESQIRQVFQNLIANGLKFRGGKPAKIEISGKLDSESGLVHFQVKDWGLGIKAESFGRVFTIFQRLHSRKDYPGNGVGLSVCKKVVMRNGGTIWIESVVSEWTTFHFTLPSVKAKKV